MTIRAATASAALTTIAIRTYGEIAATRSARVHAIPATAIREAHPIGRAATAVPVATGGPVTSAVPVGAMADATDADRQRAE